MAERTRFSIIVPAYNEELLLPRGLAAIRRAIDAVATSAEIVVVANRSTDRTESIAAAAGAVVVRDGHRNINATRNAGDWHYVTRLGTAIAHPRQLRDTIRGTTFVDEYFVDDNG